MANGAGKMNTTEWASLEHIKQHFALLQDESIAIRLLTNNEITDTFKNFCRFTHEANPRTND